MRLMWAGQYGRAREWFIAVPATDSLSGAAHVLAACCAFLVGSYADAVADGIHALDCPMGMYDSSRAYCVTGLALAKLDRNKVALEALRRAAEGSRWTVDDRFLETTDETSRLLRLGLRVGVVQIDGRVYPKPDETFVNSLRPDLQGHRGDFAWLTRNLASDQSYYLADAVEMEDASAWLDLAAEYYRLGRHDYSTSCSKKAIALAPNLPRAHLMLGLSRFYEGLSRDYVREDTESLRSCEQAIALDPDYLRAYYCLGDMYYQVGRKKACVQVFRRLARRHPDCAEALFGQGLIAVIGKKRTAALEAYAKLKPIDDELAARLFEYIYP
jgi:tetratricopeptide (TPR) repeat protein